MSPKKQTANLWPTTTITTSRYHSTSKSTNYNCTLTTLVRSLTTLRNSFYTPHHFPKFLFGFMTVSGVAGYYCMEYWYEKSVGERNEIYSAAYHHQHGSGGGVMKRQRTVRDGHYEGRRKLFFDGVMEWLSPYQQRMLQQQQQGGSNSGHEEEGRLTTLANRLTTAAPNHQSMSLQRQVTKFW